MNVTPVAANALVDTHTWAPFATTTLLLLVGATDTLPVMKPLPGAGKEPKWCASCCRRRGSAKGFGKSSRRRCRRSPGRRPVMPGNSRSRTRLRSTA